MRPAVSRACTVGQLRIPLPNLYRGDYVYDMVGDSDTLGEALFAVATLAVRRTGRDLSLTAASTLATLEGTGPRRLTDLAVNEEVTQPSMTALVTQLEGLGFAERRGDPADRRVVLVAITRTGRHHLRAMRRAGASELTALIDKLAEPDVAALGAALPALRHLLALAADSPDDQARRTNAKANSGSRAGRPDRAVTRHPSTGR
jgi:DNA-binding MarR family transcriptional regulator